ncbi:hypothetical protein D0911_10050 [Zhongshania marina]|uniref:Uncharacterized protein n=1 Tax=Zhongshania marina TaxID=2304603 RepID=A0ABX9W488_9GAMM|nr:hypothetical protein D0911_10050 [Zhongshania marina]
MIINAILNLIWGTTCTVLGIIAGVSWIAFCFGSVLGVILILLFAPPLLFLPFGLSIYGIAICSRGIDMLKKPDKYNKL